MVGPTGRAKDIHMDDMISMVGEEGVHLVIVPRITNWFRTHAVGGGGGKGMRLSLVDSFSIDNTSIASNISWASWQTNVENVKNVYGWKVSYW